MGIQLVTSLLPIISAVILDMDHSMDLLGSKGLGDPQPDSFPILLRAWGKLLACSHVVSIVFAEKNDFSSLTNLPIVGSLKMNFLL